MSEPDFPFQRPFPVATLPSRGTTVSIEADADERAGLATMMDILGIDALAADLTLAPWRRSGLKVTGRVRAAVRQACVVTLEPVEETIDEPVEITFLPPAEIEEPDEDLLLDPEADDPPEPLDGPTVDLGAIAAEIVAVSLDPYPRAPGAHFEDIVEDDGEDEPSPFSGLSRLRGDEG